MSAQPCRRRPALVLLSVVLIATTGVAVAAHDGGREETVRYVASPFGGGSGNPDFGVVGGGARFAILEDESRLRVTIADDVFDRTEVSVVFFFGDAPIRHVVTFCRQHSMDIPTGATHIDVLVEPLFPLAEGEPSTCGSGHGALTGTLSARFT